MKEQLQRIEKLGEFFRTHFSDWKINLLTDWREEHGLFIREIAHEGGGHILVFARVEVPESTFYHFHTEFKLLGNRSIGDHFLFQRDDVVREPLEVFEKEGQLVRRSKFIIDGYPLTITEYFTQEGLECLQD